MDNIEIAEPLAQESPELEHVEVHSTPQITFSQEDVALLKEAKMRKKAEELAKVRMQEMQDKDLLDKYTNELVEKQMNSKEVKDVDRSVTSGSGNDASFNIDTVSASAPATFEDVVEPYYGNAILKGSPQKQWDFYNNSVTNLVNRFPEKFQSVELFGKKYQL